MKTLELCTNTEDKLVDNHLEKYDIQVSIGEHITIPLNTDKPPATKDQKQ